MTEPTTLQDDDQFEDFPHSINCNLLMMIDPLQVQSTTEPDSTQSWQSTWEDEDQSADLSVQLE
jgi:hypothetical protein